MSGYIHWSQVNGTGLQIFNNVFTSTTGGTSNGYIYLGYADTDTAQPIAPIIVNNTFVSYSGNSVNIGINQNNGTSTIKNNIFLNFGYGFNMDSTGYAPQFDYNAYYSNTRVAIYNSSWATALSNFQTI